MDAGVHAAWKHAAPVLLDLLGPSDVAGFMHTSTRARTLRVSAAYTQRARKRACMVVRAPDNMTGPVLSGQLKTMLSTARLVGFVRCFQVDAWHVAAQCAARR